jgi:hypothetical protein
MTVQATTVEIRHLSDADLEARAAAVAADIHKARARLALIREAAGVLKPDAKCRTHPNRG